MSPAIGGGDGARGGWSSAVCLGLRVCVQGRIMPGPHGGTLLMALGPDLDAGSVE